MDPLIAQLTLFSVGTNADTVHTAIFTTSFEEEDGRWVGICHELGASAYGDTLEEARGELSDAVLLEMNEMRRLGFGEEFLADRGVKVSVTSLIKQEPTEWFLAGTGTR